MFTSRARFATRGTEVPKSASAARSQRALLGTSWRTNDDRRISRKTIAAVVSVLFVLGGSGTAYAVWTANTSTSITAQAASVGVTHEVAGLETVYPSGFAGTTTTTGTILATNPGTVPGTYSISASSVGDLASAVAVKIWKGDRDCATVPAGTPTGSWLSLPAMTGTLAPKTSATWCVQTALDNAVALQQWGKSVTVTLSTSLDTSSSWNPDPFVTSVRQSAGTANVTDPAPATPRLTVCTTSNNGQRLDLAWTSVSDTATYRVTVAGPTPGTTVVKTLTPGTDEHGFVTKQDFTAQGTYVITVYTGTLPIATDRMVKETSGNDGGITCVAP